MKAVYAIAFSVGILGAICTWMFLTVGTILIWAAFAAWACFFAIGGNNEALKNTITSNIFGCFMGWLGAAMIIGIPLGDVLTPEIWAGTVVFITVFAYITASQIPIFSSVPGTTFGYACTFAFVLQTPGKLDTAALFSASFNNALIVVPVSMVLGALFGFASAKLAAALTQAEPQSS